MNGLTRNSVKDSSSVENAIEISYATPGLSLLILVPDGTSLRDVAHQLTLTNLTKIVDRMEPIRIGVSMPLYTLRMTLLLPSKLQSMGMHSLFNWSDGTQKDLRLSHAIQRIMFWAEAGRNAFKDDGIEWDSTPELELVVDRPYLFFVRWHNITLMNGNFVL
ncbi:hypothetical protein evm_011628 [Chilo suppressalis]|nr:hypothetical protein evm_011628 [Chilo suppressalis]